MILFTEWYKSTDFRINLEQELRGDGGCPNSEHGIDCKYEGNQIEDRRQYCEYVMVMIGKQTMVDIVKMCETQEI